MRSRNGQEINDNWQATAERQPDTAQSNLIHAGSAHMFFRM